MLAKRCEFRGVRLGPVAIPESAAVLVTGQDPIVSSMVPGVTLGAVVRGRPVLFGIKTECLGLFPELVPLLADCLHKSPSGLQLVEVLRPKEGLDCVNVWMRHQATPKTTRTR